MMFFIDIPILFAFNQPIFISIVDMIDLNQIIEIKYNNGTMRSGSKQQREVLEYMLNDYQFLEDYEIIDSLKTNKYSFIAQIKNSAQKVRFIKKKFTQDLFPRFKALTRLYKSGIVLADNMFIIEQCEEHYFYVIEALLEPTNHRFRSLQQYLYEMKPADEERKAIVSKVKILIDCLHQEGQPYAGLDVRNIIVDDQGHIYLAPFQLQLELRTDNFSRAYYPPQLLTKLQEGKSEIDEMAMIRWDFWSFGCIIAQILFYHSPLFLQTSSVKQIKKIQQFAFADQLSNLDEPMRNVIKNSLNKDVYARNISTNQIAQINDAENEADLKKTVKNWKKINNQTNNQDLTELNIYKETQSGDSEFIITFLALEGISFKDELHLTASLNKKYHFYIDAIADTNKYKLNKVITLRNNFDQFTKLLQNPVKIEIKDGLCLSTILINLQSLVMMHDGRRLWNKQILGTYKADKGSSCPQVKLRLSCVLNSPQFFVQDTPNIITNPKAQISLQLQQSFQNTLTEITNTESIPRKKKKKSDNRVNIPSISQIANSISNITQNFMRKLSSTIESKSTNSLPKDPPPSLSESTS